MSTEPGNADQAKISARRLPHVVLHDFLDGATVAGLLDYAVSRQSDFAPTRLGSNAVNPEIRLSSGLRDLGGYREVLKTKILGAAPTLISQLRVSPFENPKLETELVAHGDGAFYKRHIDTRTASEQHRLRVLSCVYYFHAEPKGFDGGALRLYAIGDPLWQTFVDLEPAHNTLLAFPSWAPHEVMPVSCPSGRFADSRFAINCWLHRGGPIAM